MSEGVIVAAFGHRHEAEKAAGFLRGNGITAAIFADDAGGSYPVMGSAGVRVVVPEEDAERARKVLIEVRMLEG